MPEAGPHKGKIKFKIVSPLSLIEEDEVDKVQLPLLMGTALILPRHAPLLSALKCGKVITTTGEQEKTYFVSSGIVEVRRDICALCAWGIAQKDIKPDEIQKRLETLKKHTTYSPLEKQMHQDLIQFLESFLSG